MSKSFEKIGTSIPSSTFYSDYYDAAKLEDRQKVLNKGKGSQSMSNLDFNDVKEGLKKGTLGGQSLENLKGTFHLSN